jgi:hypothetical protein
MNSAATWPKPADEDLLLHRVFELTSPGAYTRKGGIAEAAGGSINSAPSAAPALLVQVLPEAGITNRIDIPVLILNLHKQADRP